VLVLGDHDTISDREHGSVAIKLGCGLFKQRTARLCGGPTQLVSAILNK